MADVTTIEALLINALQDLHDAERAMVERLPAVAGAVADSELHELLGADAKRSNDQMQAVAATLEVLDAETEGAPNIWLRAILDDANRDAETVAKGRLLDIALTGAIRKGKQSQRVSYATAIALAARLEHGEAEATLTELRDAAAQVDEQLSTVLERLSETA